MEYRQFGGSGMRVPVLSFGTATFGGGDEFFRAWGDTDVAEAKTLVDTCLDSGVHFFDTASSYSAGRAEEILGAAIEGKRERVLLSTKVTFAMGPGPNQWGSSRLHLVRECEASLRRLRTDRVEVLYLHGFDATTPIEETLRALDDLVRSGKVLYVGCSNFSGWHLMKSLSISERHGWVRHVAHQVYYSLVGRELEWELMPLHLDQRVGSVIWSPLAGGALSGKVRRGRALPEGSRVAKMDFVVSARSERVYDVVDVLEEVAKEVGKTVAQVALRWVLQRPTVCNVVFGARNATQLRENLGAVDWTLGVEHVAKLDAVSERRPVYPYWHQRGFPQLIPPIVPQSKG